MVANYKSTTKKRWIVNKPIKEIQWSKKKKSIIPEEGGKEQKGYKDRSCSHFVALTAGREPSQASVQPQGVHILKKKKEPCSKMAYLKCKG